MKKKKIGRPRSENPMVHTAVVLPAELIARLKADAEAKGQRLERRDQVSPRGDLISLQGKPQRP